MSKFSLPGYLAIINATLTEDEFELILRARCRRLADRLAHGCGDDSDYRTSLSFSFTKQGAKWNVSSGPNYEGVVSAKGEVLARVVGAAIQLVALQDDSKLCQLAGPAGEDSCEEDA